MRHHSPILPLLGLCLCLAATSGAYDAAPAAILTDSNPINNAFVLEERLDGISFVLDDPRSPAKSFKNRNQYKSVQYGDPKDLSFKAAEIQYEKGEHDRAADNYRKAIDNANYQWVVERSYLQAAISLADPRVNKVDQSLALLDTYLTKFPQSAHRPYATALRADLRLAKGDLAGAEADYVLLEQNAEAWGSSRGRGTLGRAAVLRQGKKYDEALALLRPVFAASKPNQNANDWAKLGLGVSELQHLAAKKDEAVSLLRQIAFSPASVELRCVAHLRLAKILQEGATGEALARAFDHAVLAAHPDADSAVDTEARALAKKLVALIEKDKTFSDEDRREYRSYTRNL